MAELGGTFVPDSHGCSAGVFASTEFIPEVAEEEERLQGPSKYVGIEELPDSTPAERPYYISMPGTLEESLRMLLAKSPKWALVVYQRARGENNAQILTKLPEIVRGLVTNGTYSAAAFQACPTDSGYSCYRIFKGLAKNGCPVAREIFAAISSDSPTVAKRAA